MVIMDPDLIIGFCQSAYDITEMIIYPLICLPVFVLILNVLRKVMKERPDDLVAESVVVVFDAIGRQEDRKTIVRLEFPFDKSYFFLFLAYHVAGPADPETILRFMECLEPAC